MPRFVILHHEIPPASHFDFMLELGDSLRTWSLSQSPTPDAEIDAMPLADHRLAYLDYEGPVSGNRGSVTTWDRGTYKIENESQSELVVQLLGEKLVGTATLRKIPGTENTCRFVFTAKSR